MFKANEHLEEAILNKNVVRIRSTFTVIAHEDPAFSTGKFYEALDYVKSKNIDGLFDSYDGRPFKSREEWNEDYWALLVSSLVSNFCMERINHLKDVGRSLYSPKQEPSYSAPSSSTTSSSSSSSRSAYINSYSTSAYRSPSKKALPIAVTAGLAITCVTAIAVGAKFVAVTAGVAAVAAGVYTIMKD